MPPTLLTTSYFNNTGFIGVAGETTKGTPVTATEWVQLLDESLTLKPGIISEKLARGSRQVAFVPAVGEQEISGKIDTPLFVDQGLKLFAAAVTTDTFQNSTLASTTVAIGGSGLSSGATQFQIATQTGTPITANDYIQLQQAAGTPSTSNLSEVHKVASVSGAGPYTVVLAGTESLFRAYTATGVVARVPAGTTTFTHNLWPDQPSGTSYKTLTIEKNRAGMDSRQYAGATVNKMSLTMDPKTLIKASYDVTALADASTTASTPSFVVTAPLAIANVSLSLFGSQDFSVNNMTFDLDNGAKSIWTFNGGNMPALVPPLARKISGKWSNVVQSGTYYTNAGAGTTGALKIALIQGSNSITLNVPKFQIMDIGQPLKVGELFMYDISWQADYDETTAHDLDVQIVNENWLPILAPLA